MGVAGGLANAARSITSQAAVTVGRPFDNKMAPRHALHVPSLSNWTLKRGEGRDSVQSCQRAFNAPQFGACKIPHLAGPAISRERDGQLHSWVVGRAAEVAA